MVAYFPSREGPREAPNKRMKERIESADKRKSELSGIIRENMEDILSGKFTEEDLIKSPLNFNSKKALTAFLVQNFLARSLKEIAIGIKTLDPDNRHPQKTADFGKPEEIKFDKEALTERILSEVKPKMSTLALARRLKELIDAGALPAEAKLCKIFNTKALRELSVDMIAKWEVNNLK